MPLCHYHKFFPARPLICDTLASPALLFFLGVSTISILYNIFTNVLKCLSPVDYVLCEGWGFSPRSVEYNAFLALT